MTKIAVVDYGMGNLRSVEKAIQRVGGSPIRTSEHDVIRSAKGLVLPGVGAFRKAMQNLRDLELDSLLAEQHSAGVPIMGICLGMQLLFDSSSEGDGSSGLGLLQGGVEKLDTGDLKVPLIGWNPVKWKKRSRLVNGLKDGTPFYFVHSYAPIAKEPEDVLATAEYGSEFVCAVERGHLFGFQCHPEKSSDDGLHVLKNFVEIAGEVGR